MSAYDTYYAYRYAERGDLEKMMECLSKVKEPSRWYVHNPDDDDADDNIDGYDINDFHYDDDLNGAIAIHVAAINGHFDCLSAILTRDPGSSARMDYSGRTPLHLASDNCVKLLISDGADVDALDNDEKCPLYGAAALGRVKCCQLLLEAGCNVDQADSSNVSSLFIASECGHTKTIEVLLDYNANVNIETRSGTTPLIAAAGEDKAKACQLLLSRGANPEIRMRSSHNVTALGYAALCNSTKSLRVLCDAGASIDKDMIEKIMNKRLILSRSEDEKTKLIVLDEIENRLRKKSFELFIKLYIEYKIYKDAIYSMCYPNDTTISLPSIGWLQAEKIRDKYYHDEVLFYVHLHVAEIIMISSKKTATNVTNTTTTTVTASICKEYFANNDNKTFALMKVLADRLKEVSSSLL